MDVVLWALYTFEALSVIKINYFKTELIPINLRHTKKQTLAAMIVCNLNSFLIFLFGYTFA
jgi:hypothetical protein